MDIRPKLNKKISAKDFEDFYWLKEELVKFCRTLGIKSTGSKIEISQNISTYLKTGKKEEINSKKENKPKSKFDWNNEILTLETIISDNYKNTENVREFFQNKVGSKFKFNVKFMNWMKLNTGKNLNDAIQQWNIIQKEIKNNTKPKEIAPQFEYNTYLRDYLLDNPNSTRELAIKLWKLKKKLRGSNLYSKEDLKLIE